MTRTERWTQLWSVLRLAMGLLIAAAILAQAIVTIGSAVRGERDVGTTLANFFSYFTILSNTASVVVLLWAAIWYFRRGRDASVEPFALALALASVSTYMIVTGVVYNTLLRGIELAQGTTVGWSNEVMHLVGPLFFLADLFLGPLRRQLAWRAIGAIVVFPVVWIVYTLIRALITTNPINGDPYWYPYPFLDPNGDRGYGGVVFYVVAIAIAISIFATLTIWVGRRRGALPETAASAEASRVPSVD